MIQNKRNILVTTSLDGQQIEYARILGLKPFIQPALSFNFPDYWDRILGVLNDHVDSDWIFTSQNGVIALKELMKSGLNIRPQTTVFAVGSRTQDALRDLGVDALKPPEENSVQLAELIIKEGKVNSVIYFHGNLSRNEMVDRLEEKDIDVIGLEVYETVIEPVYLPVEPIDAILFFSPSGVKAFKQGEGFETELPALYAIGPTTEEALKKETGRKVITASEPSVEALLHKVSENLFKEEKNVN